MFIVIAVRNNKTEVEKVFVKAHMKCLYIMCLLNQVIEEKLIKSCYDCEQSVHSFVTEIPFERAHAYICEMYLILNICLFTRHCSGNILMNGWPGLQLSGSDNCY